MNSHVLAPPGRMLLPSLPPPPPPLKWWGQCLRRVAVYGVFAVVWPWLCIFHLVTLRHLPWKDFWELAWLVQSASGNPINLLASYQDAKLLQQVYQLPSAQHYLQKEEQEQVASEDNRTTSSTKLAVEWQRREGFCANATLRTILKSFPNFPTMWLPSVKPGANDPEHFCEALELANQDTSSFRYRYISELIRFLPSNNENSDNIDKKATLISSYDQFVQILDQNLKNDKIRIAINFLRPALMGFQTPWYTWPFVPAHFFLGVFGGHFSVVLGMIPSITNTPTKSSNTTTSEHDNHEPLVAILDVNHNYGGTYLVPARRLYHAMRAKGISTLQSRALILVREQARPQH